MVFHPILFLLLSPLFPLYNGEQVHEEALKDAKQGSIGKTRGEQLATQTNSELISSSEKVQLASASVNQCSQDGSTCLTCRSVGMCKNGVMTEVPCRGLYPYCDARTGSCTNERKRCKEEEKAIVCPFEGFYPDPQSCRAFHVCEGNPMASFKFACSSLQIYDHKEKKCATPSFRVRCASFSCFGKQGRYTPYSADHSIYTLCADASATSLFKCPENQEFDETKQKCIPACQSEESIPDTDDDQCRKYYKCVKSIRKIDAVPSVCPPQQIFDRSQLKCIPEPASFRCSHSSIGSIQSTTPPGSIVEETYFRQTPHEKSASIIGSVQYKEEVKETVLPPKSTTSGLPQDNVAAVITQLSESHINGDSHKVLREALTTKPIETTTTTIKPSEDKHATTQSKINKENGENTNAGTHIPTKSETVVTHNPIIHGQTYKVTTTEQYPHSTILTQKIKEQSSATKEEEPSQQFHVKDDNIADKIDIKSNTARTHTSDSSTVATPQSTPKVNKN